MGEAQGAATGEDQSDFWFAGFRFGRLLRQTGACERKKGSEKDQRASEPVCQGAGESLHQAILWPVGWRRKRDRRLGVVVRERLELSTSRL